MAASWAVNALPAEVLVSRQVMRGLPDFQQVYASFAGITERIGLAGHGTIAAYTLLRTCLARTQADSNNSPVTHLRGLCIREISVTVVQKVQA